MKDPGSVVILGAGPTGLGAAYRFAEHGLGDFALYEITGAPGGLASSHVDAEGFTWDVGGHVQFSHYDYYDRVLDRALGDDWLWHERESWIWIAGRFVPYPFQNNVHRLDAVDRDRCLAGLEEAASRPRRPPAHFGDWVEQTFGHGVADLFMVPYNRKVWGYPLERLGTSWMGDRVAVPDLARIRENVRHHRDDVAWGPNSTFRFPRHGGTGAIWHAVARLIDPRRMSFGVGAHAVDLATRSIDLTDGRRIRYERLVSTLPLDTLASLCTGLSARARAAADALVYSAVHIIGVGLRGERPPALARKCWMYFPEAHSPYYRVTVFSNYSPHNVPDAGTDWSLMAEVCETPERRVDAQTLPARVVAALRRDALIPRGAAVVSVWSRREEHGYPTPYRGRDEDLAVLRPELEARGVSSRGRFGAWMYEVSNQDHSFMQGVEVADRLLGAGEETTVVDPERVNRGAFLTAGPRTAGR